eukprot:1772620-Rhodomonas_salina.1
MTITGSVPEQLWEENLHAMGIEEPHSTVIHRQAVINAVRALSEYLRVRLALAQHNFPLEDNFNSNSNSIPSGFAGS